MVQRLKERFVERLTEKSVSRFVEIVAHAKLRRDRVGDIDGEIS
jgi:hypothetical protein